LVLRRGLPLIVIVALVAGTVTYLSVSLQPKLFRASSIVIVAPPSANFVGEGVLRFQPVVYMTLNGYSALAHSNSVMEETLKAHPETNLTVAELKAASSVVRNGSVVANGVEKGLPLIVVHRFFHADPDTAADLTNTWVEATSSAVRKYLLTSLAPSNSSIDLQLQELAGELKAAEAQWQAFRALDNVELLESSLVNTNHQIVKGTNRLNELDSLIKMVEREQIVLESQLLEISGFTPLDFQSDIASLAKLTFSQAQQILVAQLVLYETHLTAARQALKTFLTNSDIDDLKAKADILFGSDVNDQATVPLTLLGAQSDKLALEGKLRTSKLALELSIAEKAALRGQLQELRAEAGNLLARQSELALKRENLSRRLSETRTAYEVISTTSTAIKSVRDLTLASVNTLILARPPKKPFGGNPWHPAVVAAVIAGMATTLPFFLREAVRSPVAPTDSPVKRKVG
jgi:hypothetical protein